MNDHDVVIIGGSLAGAACVRELERLGIDAIALERDRFPRPKVCGGFLSHGAVEAVRRVGLLKEVLNAGGVEIRSARVRAVTTVVDIPFDRPGLGISRNALDDIFARGARVRQGCMVREVERCDDGFCVDGLRCSVVIDAAGKLSRFTKRTTTEEFGVQYMEAPARGAVLNFWFFDDGYGGSVSVEGGRSNSCFLVKKSAVTRFAGRADCLVTGPLAYDKLPGGFIAIGDAAGMVDPFCGEGIRHAIETGILAAQIVAAGIRRHAAYEEMRWEYQSRWERRWMLRRAAGAGIRRLLKHADLGLRVAPPWLINRLWD
jgi:flavin-dependent dehydrogenase